MKIMILLIKIRRNKNGKIVLIYKIWDIQEPLCISSAKLHFFVDLKRSQLLLF